MPGKEKHSSVDPRSPLDGLSPLARPRPAQPGGDIRVAGRVRALGPEHVAVLAYPPETRHFVVARADVKAAEHVAGATEDPIVSITLSSGAPVFLAAATYAGTAAALLRVPHAAGRSLPTGAAAAPFVLATPHHAPVAYYPRSLGGPLAVAGGAAGAQAIPVPPAADAYGRLLATPITLPEGPVDLARGDEGEPPPLASDSTTFLTDPITLPEGPVGPPAPKDPLEDGVFPAPGLPGFPPSSGPTFPLPEPPPLPKPPLDDLIPPFLRKFTPQFGDPFSLDFTFDF